MEKMQLKASGRDLKTSKPEKLRRTGQLPAVLYGHKVKNSALTIDAREFDKILKKAGESTIIDLETGDGKTHPVLIHEVQYHYLNSRPIHVDFYEVSMSEKLKAKVVLDFTGEAPAVKTLGGVLVKVLSEVEVECLPADLPHSLPVNLENLKTLQDALYVKDLAAPPKVKIITPAEELVIKVQPPRDVEAELATPVVEDVSKVEGAAETKPAEETTAQGAAETKESKKE
ncbi:MAG: 50S ribosomal protein L25 [Patescibacteria group bacterium]|nr:50S ribosomal protein L25 [Patescibacteria group bacterium]